MTPAICPVCGEYRHTADCPMRPRPRAGAPVEEPEEETPGGR